MFVIYGATRVEARYGLPLILLVVPLAAGGFRRLRRLPTRPLILVASAIVLYAITGYLTSEWMRSLSPPIIKWQHTHLSSVAGLVSSADVGADRANRVIYGRALLPAMHDSFHRDSPQGHGHLPQKQYASPPENFERAARIHRRTKDLRNTAAAGKCPGPRERSVSVVWNAEGDPAAIVGTEPRSEAGRDHGEYEERGSRKLTWLRGIECEARPKLFESFRRRRSA